MELIVQLSSVVIIVGIIILLLLRHTWVKKVVDESLTVTLLGCFREMKYKNKEAYYGNVKREVLFSAIRIILFIGYVFLSFSLKGDKVAYAYILLAPILLLGIKNIIDLLSDIIKLNKLLKE